MLHKTVSATLAILATAVISGVAHAHPVLKTVSPAQDAMVSPPKEIRLTFSENVIPKFSGVTIKDKGGSLVETASPSTDPGDKRQLVVPITKPLPPGTYDVDWHAVSVDTHRVTGHFSFQVAQ